MLRNISMSTDCNTSELLWAVIRQEIFNTAALHRCRKHTERTWTTPRCTTHTHRGLHINCRTSWLGEECFTCIPGIVAEDSRWFRQEWREKGTNTIKIQICVFAFCYACKIYYFNQHTTMMKIFFRALKSKDSVILLIKYTDFSINNWSNDSVKVSWLLLGVS